VVCGVWCTVHSTGTETYANVKTPVLNTYHRNNIPFIFLFGTVCRSGMFLRGFITHRTISYKDIHSGRSESFRGPVGFLRGIQRLRMNAKLSSFDTPSTPGFDKKRFKLSLNLDLHSSRNVTCHTTRSAELFYTLHWC
jgi:hypothetical protein